MPLSPWHVLPSWLRLTPWFWGKTGIGIRTRELPPVQSAHSDCVYLHALKKAASRMGTRWPPTPLTGAGQRGHRCSSPCSRAQRTPSPAVFPPQRLRFLSRCGCESGVGEGLLSPDARSTPSTRASHSSGRIQPSVGEARRPARPLPGARGSLEFSRFFWAFFLCPILRKPASRGAEKTCSDSSLCSKPCFADSAFENQTSGLDTFPLFASGKGCFMGPLGGRRWVRGNRNHKGEVQVIGFSGRTHACSETHI